VKALAILGLTCLVSACAVPRADVSAFRPDVGKKIKLPVDATLLVYESGREKRGVFRVHGGYGTQWDLHPGEDLDHASTEVSRKYFKNVQPFALDGVGHFVLRLSSKPELDTVWGSYKTTVNAELFSMDGALIDSGETQASTISAVINDKNAFFNSYAKAIKSYLDTLLAKDPSGALSRVAGTAPSKLTLDPASVKKFLTLSATGSGFYVNRDGYVVTNHHVVSECVALTVNQGGNEGAATLVAKDPDHDLALLRTNTKPERFARFAEIGVQARLGDSVITVGYPLYGVLSATPSVTTGSVSSLAGLQDSPAQLQISAPIQPGNSGGPLLGERGQVHGIVQSSIDAVRLARYTGSLAQNINFAVKASHATALMLKSDIQFETEPRGSAVRSVPEIAEEAASYTVQVMCLD